jgi:replicative DNA helicase
MVKPWRGLSIYDQASFIYRGDIFEPNTDIGAKLLVLKQRNGPTGEVRLVFNNMFARFDERAEPHQERLALQRVR